MPKGDISAITRDGFLGGRLSIRQPADGYRAGGDPVFLAAAVAARPGERVLDLGCGVGTAALCLLARLGGVSAVGLEVQPDLADLAATNALENGLADRFCVVKGSLSDLPASIEAGDFDHVMTNPPWLEAARTQAPRSPGKAICHVEGKTDLVAWLAAAVRLLGPKGTLAVIHRADRLGDLLAALMAQPVGGVIVRPLWPKRDKPAIRVIVTARKGAKTPLALVAGLVMHEDDGRFTDMAEAVLRRGRGLEESGER